VRGEEANGLRSEENVAAGNIFIIESEV